MKRAQLYVSSIGEDCCESARDFGVGIELAQFCTAARLDGAPPEPWECPLDRCLAAADRFVQNCAVLPQKFQTNRQRA